MCRKVPVVVVRDDGAPAIRALRSHPDKHGVVIEVVADTGRVTTPPLPLSEAASTWLARMVFEMSPEPLI